MTLPLFLAILVVVSIGCLAVVIRLCRTAPYGEQTDEGFFYVKPLGGDHE